MKFIPPVNITRAPPFLTRTSPLNPAQPIIIRKILPRSNKQSMTNPVVRLALNG